MGGTVAGSHGILGVPGFLPAVGRVPPGAVEVPPP
jgi:hypothetical protein